MNCVTCKDRGPPARRSWRYQSDFLGSVEGAAARLGLGLAALKAGVGSQIVFDAMLEILLSTPWLLTAITPKNQVPELRLSIT